MKYEITIRELTPFTEDEIIKLEKGRREMFSPSVAPAIHSTRYSDKPFHETRVLSAEVSREEFEAVKKAIIGTL